jgi:hypothetical protein
MCVTGAGAARAALDGVIGQEDFDAMHVMGTRMHVAGSARLDARYPAAASRTPFSIISWPCSLPEMHARAAQTDTASLRATGSARHARPWPAPSSARRA